MEYNSGYTEDKKQRLTKAQVLNGKYHVEYIYIEKLGGEIGLRPLTDGEYSTVETMKMGGMVIQGRMPEEKGAKFRTEDIKLDIEHMQKRDYEANCKACAWSMSVDGTKYTENEIKTLPQGAVAEIAKHAYEITGVKPKGVEQYSPLADKEEAEVEENISSFRKVD